MQKGFAALELVLVIFIIAVLASCAVPNAARIIDRVALDYETKRLYTELRFLQSHERMTSMRDSHFKIIDSENPVTVEINGTHYIIKKRDPEKIYEKYFLPKGFTLSYPANMNFRWIKFDNMGKPQSSDNSALNGHIFITSRHGKKTKIIFDTVGRFRGERVDETIK